MGNTQERAGIHGNHTDVGSFVIHFLMNQYYENVFTLQTQCNNNLSVCF